MAILFASSSAIFSYSSSLDKPSFSSLKEVFQVTKAHFLDLSLVPDNQHWMFKESEANGPHIWNTTWYPKANDHVNTAKPWYIVDATDKILRRLASTIVVHIRGNNLATYTSSVDMGAFVIVMSERSLTM
ncbi:hypothetical protein REPUB_Repub05bG0080900 [Reevesia pubescens]